MGLILPQEIEINISNRNVKRYIDLGYNIPIIKASESYQKRYHKEYRYDFSQKIIVDVCDLPNSSKEYVYVGCDICGKIFKVAYCNYNNVVKNTGSYVCYDCKGKKASNTIMKKFNVPNISMVDYIKEKKKKTTLQHYGVENPFESEIIKQRSKKTMLEKYGVEYAFQNEELYSKYIDTMINRYGADNPLKVKEIYDKVMTTNMIKYGGNPSFSKEVQKKIAKSLFDNKSQMSSKQQRYINNLYQGELNYPCKYYSLDIALLDDMIDVEVDFGGHNLSVKCGYITQEEFDQKEIIRSNIVKREGWKQIHLISRKDKLPSDEILLQILEISKKYFNTTEHTWINFDIDNNKYFNAEHQDGVLFDFGELRTLRRNTA